MKSQVEAAAPWAVFGFEPIIIYDSFKAEKASQQASAFTLSCQQASTTAFTFSSTQVRSIRIVLLELLLSMPEVDAQWTEGQCS